MAELSDEKPEWLTISVSNNTLLSLVREDRNLALSLCKIVRSWFGKVHSGNPPYNVELKKSSSGKEYFRCSITTTLGLFKGEWCTDKDLSEATCLALLFGQLLFNEYSSVMVNEGGYLDVPGLEEAYTKLVAAESVVGPLTLAELSITKADVNSRMTKLFSSRTTLVDKQANQNSVPRARRDLGMNLFNAWVAKQELIDPDSPIWGKYEYADFYQYIHRLYHGGIYDFYLEIANRELQVDGGGFDTVEEMGEKFCISVGPSNPVPTWLSNRRAALSRRVNSSLQVVELKTPDVSPVAHPIDHVMNDL